MEIFKRIKKYKILVIILIVISSLCICYRIMASLDFMPIFNLCVKGKSFDHIVSVYGYPDEIKDNDGTFNMVYYRNDNIFISPFEHIFLIPYSKDSSIKWAYVITVVYDNGSRVGSRVRRYMVNPNSYPDSIY